MTKYRVRYTCQQDVEFEGKEDHSEQEVMAEISFDTHAECVDWEVTPIGRKDRSNA